eukprot:750163-Hanusia_phi.AAC.5
MRHLPPLLLDFTLNLTTGLFPRVKPRNTRYTTNIRCRTGVDDGRPKQLTQLPPYPSLLYTLCTPTLLHQSTGDEGINPSGVGVYRKGSVEMVLDGVREMMSAKAAAEEEMKLETVKRRKKYKEIQRNVCRYVLLTQATGSSVLSSSCDHQAPAVA